MTKYILLTAIALLMVILPARSQSLPNLQPCHTFFKSGLTQYQAQQYQAAQQTWQQALICYRGFKAPREEAHSLNNLSAVANQLSQFKTTLDLAPQALKLAQQLQDIPLQINALGNIGLAYRATGQYSQVIATYQQALQLAKTIPNTTSLQIDLLSNLGDLYADLGNYSEALKLYQQGMTEKTATARQQANLLIGFASIYSELDQADRAITTYQEGLAIARQLGDPILQTDILNNLGGLYLSRDRNNAEQLLKESLKLSRQANLLQQQASANSNLGMLAELRQQYQSAIQFYQESLNLSRKSGNDRAQGIALNNLAHTLFSANQLKPAIDHLRAALTIWDNLRQSLPDAYQISLFDTQVSTYNLLQQVLVADKQYEAALEVSEWGRSRPFIQQLNKRQARRQTPNLEATSDGLRSVVDHRPTIQTLKQIAKAQNTTLVEYTLIPESAFSFLGKQRGNPEALFIWVVLPTGQVQFRQIDLKTPKWQNKSIGDRVMAARLGLGVAGRGAGIEIEPLSPEEVAKLQDDPWRDLYQLLIEPIAPLLLQDTNVTFIPQEELFLLPFAALKTPSGQYLIEQYAIRTLPSIQTLAITHPQSKPSPIQPQEALIIAIPEAQVIEIAGKPETMIALPAAAREAEAIQKIFNTQALLGPQAKKQVVLDRMAQAKVIHFATHGLLDYEGVSSTVSTDLRVPGAIVLAAGGNRPSDALLTANELSQLDLKTELVVLSACDTGRGRITGDGVIGLSRSLITAGVPSVIVSLWSIPDAPTEALMVTFYRNWQERGLNKAEALQQAMLTTLKTYPNPRDWAAFTLIGEAG